MERIEGNMLYTVPHYYRKFQCTASACTDTCCAGWQIMIDDASLKKYRKRRDIKRYQAHLETV